MLVAWASEVVDGIRATHAEFLGILSLGSTFLVSLLLAVLMAG